MFVMNELLDQTYGVEIEMYRITRKEAAAVVANRLSKEYGKPYVVSYYGGHYDAWRVHPYTERPSCPETWQVVSDASIRDAPQCETELVTPILRWSDMPVLQEVVRDLRKAGARSDPEHLCGIHVHVGADGHTPRSLVNLANLMAAHESLLVSAMALDQTRITNYARPVSQRFLDAINVRKPKTMQELREAWYGCSFDLSSQHYHESRYHILNLHSFFAGKGVEFRMF